MNSFVKQLMWFQQPDHNHIVQFYPGEDILLRYLGKFVSAGLNEGDACIVIATEEHMRALDSLLEAKGFDLPAARKQNLYVTLDARKTLDSFMREDMPDRELFMKNVGGTLKKLSYGNKNVRAYGEMVALLWQEGKPEAMIELEKLWNDLTDILSFSLYCAYPSEEFEGKHHKIISEIYEQHSLSV